MSGESALRRRAARRGLALHKSRRALSFDHQGGWQIREPDRNMIVAGERYDWTDEDVERYLGPA